jgi:hypothetical protein
MVAGACLAVLLATGIGGTDPVRTGPRTEALRVGARAAAPDTVRVRRKAVQLSEAYHLRLQVHKYASYLTLPLFIAEYTTGERLLKEPRYSGSSWARDVHPALAGAVAGLFGLNTLTGGLNWWETRNQPQGSAWRTAHSVLMLVADAGFVATGALAGDDGGESGLGAVPGNSGNQRRAHRAVAIGSMSVATVSYLMMLKPFRRD